MSKLEVREIGPISGETEVRLADGATAIGFGGGLASVQTFTSSGTWTKPSGVRLVMVEVQGGGGGGSRDNSSVNKCAGGGSGAYARKLIDVSSISSATITVGSGGMGATAIGPGQDGGNSIWADGVNANVVGGGGGGATQGITNDPNTSPGGIASGGDLNIDGQQAAVYQGGNYSLRGADSFLGSGGERLEVSPFQEVAATGYGSGGFGGSNAAAQDGRPGIVIVTEYT